MSIPFNPQLNWATYKDNVEWPYRVPVSVSKTQRAEVTCTKILVDEVAVNTFKQSFNRSVQFVRDALRLVLKVPARAIWTPIILPKNWKERERAKINATLTGYSLVQLVSVPAKFLVALSALAVSAVSLEKAQYLLDKSENMTAYLDGRASQLEALKEQGRPNASNRKEYNQYKEWLYNIDPKRCRKE